MIAITRHCFSTTVVALLVAGASLRAQETITISKDAWTLNAKPTLIAVSGFSGEADQVLRFDLEVMGCKIVPAESAQFQVTGANNGRVEGRLIDLVSKAQLLGKAYTGGTLRRQAHALADEIVGLLPNHGKGIAQTHIAYKAEQGGRTEIAMADFDGFNAKPVTSDDALVAAPAWVPGRLALYYTSYKRGNPDIFFQDLSTGARHVFAQFPGLNSSAAPSSPDGRKVAMILSKGGSPDVYVSDADGSNLRQLTRTREDESSPCWSPDGQWICYATKVKDRRVLRKVSVSGGEPQTISTSGVSGPSEPDWSPDGKWIAFTAQMGDFQVCVIPASGGMATVLCEGEDASWAPNSRNLIFVRRGGSGHSLSLLDVPTKQVKDVRRVSGSQPSWAK